MALVKCSLCVKEFMHPSDFHRYECDREGDCEQYSDVLTQFENQGLQSTFAVVGAKESGKSYFIYSLLYQLLDNPNETLKEYLRRLNMNVELIGNTSRQQYERFKSKLLSEQLEGTLKQDVENNIPLLLSIKIGRGRQSSSIKLSFFDLAGEHFTSRDFMQSDPRIFKARGVLFLMDPYQDFKLNSHVKNQAYTVGVANGFDILDNLYHAINNNMTRKLKKINIPIAFCISMFDLLEHLVPEQVTQQPYCEIDDLITKQNCFDERLTKQKTREFKRFLSDHSRISTYNLEDKFSNHAIFAFSAIGHNEIEDIRIKGLQSRGIIAPLLWLLAKTGFIKMHTD